MANLILTEDFTVEAVAEAVFEHLEESEHFSGFTAELTKEAKAAKIAQLKDALDEYFNDVAYEASYKEEDLEEIVAAVRKYRDEVIGHLPNTRDVKFANDELDIALKLHGPK